MKKAFSWRISITLLSIAVLSGCGGRQTSEGDLTGTVQIDGSSTVFPITEAVAEEFMAQHPGVRVTVGVSGTGGGFSKFVRGETDITNASRLIKESEMQLAEQNGIEFIELPVAYDGLAVMVNPANDWVDCLTAEELKKIWEPGSRINSWSQVRPGFPDREIKLYGPGTDSGTYDYFTEAVVGEAGASRADYTASEDDNVLVQGIAGDQASLGFFGLAYYEENQSRLKLLGIDDEDPSNGEGCIQPTAETVENGTYSPLSRPLFIYARKDEQSEAARAFVEFYLDNAGVLAPEVGYVALGDDTYDLAHERFTSGITGTMYPGGSTAGITLKEAMGGSTGTDSDTTAAAQPDTIAN